MAARTEHHLKSRCPIARALDVIGDHWTLLIIRDLMFGGKHEYKEMLASEEGIASNILSDRLKKLEDMQIIASAAHPQSKRRKLYYLTERGKGLIFVMLDIIRWSAVSLDDRVDIPDEKRPTVENSPEEVARNIRRQLADWEAENLK